LKNLLYLFVFIIALSNTWAQTIYDAQISDKEILTPLPNKAPKINGPKLYGARPGNEFIYRIPCQGERPIKFKIKGLPKELNLDSNTGIITGIVPKEKGDYGMTVIATNKHGKVNRRFKLVVGEGIALTPPTGWNSWGGHMLMITDEIMRKTTNVFVEKGFADVGFQYISIDDCWMKTSQENFEARNDFKKQQHEGFEFDGLVGELTINSTPLVWTDEEINGRFTLYPTENMYNFILLDQINGKTWQVQWNNEVNKRFISRIY
jgi:alpha-galactosidase